MSVVSAGEARRTRGWQASLFPHGLSSRLAGLPFMVAQRSRRAKWKMPGLLRPRPEVPQLQVYCIPLVKARPT